jgi:hypothetical protein
MNEVKERRAAMALRVAGILLVLLAIWFLTSCKDKGTGPDPPETTKYTKTITASENGTELDGVTFSIDGDVIGADTDAVEVTRETGTAETVTAAKDGFNDGSQTITFSDGSSESIELERADPETVAISYEIRSASSDTLVVADVVNQATGETLAAAEASGTITLPFSDAATTLCAAPQYFGEGCVEVTPDGDKSIVIRITRESVNVSASAEDTDGNTVENADIAVDGEIIGQGSISESFPARAGTRTISASAEDFSEDAETVSAGAAAEVTLQLERVFACSDGIDNDGDGNIDEADGGCVANDSPTADPRSPDWVYDPEDESEEFRVVGNTLTLPSDDIDFVSSKEGERIDVLIGLQNFPNTIAFAVGEIEFSVANRKEADQAGEAFALEFVCGEDDENFEQFDHSNTTDIVPDDQSIDGWVDSFVRGITREYFSEGSSCSIYILHATEVRDEPFGDGEDDVVTETPEQNGQVRYRYGYEPEEVQ